MAGLKRFVVCRRLQSRRRASAGFVVVAQIDVFADFGHHRIRAEDGTVIGFGVSALGSSIQGDTSRWSKPPVDTKTNVAF